MTLLTQGAKIGDRQLTVADTTGFINGNVSVGAQVFSATIESKTVLRLNNPILKAEGVGEKVFFGAILFDHAAKPLVPASSSMILAPAQRASINMTVATDAGGAVTTQAVLPVIVQID